MADPSLARRLRALRLERGLSMTDLSRRSGIGRSYLYQLEQETSPKSPSVTLAARLAAALDVSLGAFVGEATAEGANGTLPPTLAAYLAAHAPRPALEGLMRAIAPYARAGATVEDWAFIAEALERSVLPRARSSRDTARP